MFSDLIELFAQFVRPVAVVNVFLLLSMGVFLIDYHRKETPTLLVIFMWCYFTVILGVGVGVALNAVLVPEPTPGVYVFTAIASVVVLIMGAVSVKAVQHR